MDAIAQRTIEPLGGRKTKFRVCAAMGVPRIGWNDFWGCAQEALSEFGLPIRKFTGCFWAQQMQMAIETCVRDNFDYVLCLDYDTMFTAKQLKRLLQLSQIKPDAHAIAALQRKRDSAQPILGIAGKSEAYLNGALLPVDFAHFGFTLIKIDALRRMPKPWFDSKPDPMGGWDANNGAIYPDNFFWSKWKECGNSLYVATDIRVGHLEVGVSGFDAQYQPIQQTVSEWTRENRPQAVNACTD